MMTKLREKAQGQVKQMVGQMVGDHKLELEGKEQQRNAEHEQAVATPDQGKRRIRKPRTQNVHKADTDKSVSLDQTRETTGRKGPLLE
jgi:uncharacterized protein YjbJ (UPF0337 family)